MFLDGKHLKSSYNVAPRLAIAKGSLFIGQYQSLKTPSDFKQSFHGQITEMQMWKSDTIEASSVMCFHGAEYGDMRIFTWHAGSKPNVIIDNSEPNSIVYIEKINITKTACTAFTLGNPESFLLKSLQYTSQMTTLPTASLKSQFSNISTLASILITSSPKSLSFWSNETNMLSVNSTLILKHNVSSTLKTPVFLNNFSENYETTSEKSSIQLKQEMLSPTYNVTLDKNHTDQTTSYSLLDTTGKPSVSNSTSALYPSSQTTPPTTSPTSFNRTHYYSGTNPYSTNPVVKNASVIHSTNSYTSLPIITTQSNGGQYSNEENIAKLPLDKPCKCVCPSEKQITNYSSQPLPTTEPVRIHKRFIPKLPKPATPGTPEIITPVIPPTKYTPKESPGAESVGTIFIVSVSTIFLAILASDYTYLVRWGPVLRKNWNACLNCKKCSRITYKDLIKRRYWRKMRRASVLPQANSVCGVSLVDHVNTDEMGSPHNDLANLSDIVSVYSV